MCVTCHQHIHWIIAILVYAFMFTAYWLNSLACACTLLKFCLAVLFAGMEQICKLCYCSCNMWCVHSSWEMYCAIEIYMMMMVVMMKTIPQMFAGWRDGVWPAWLTCWKSLGPVDSSPSLTFKNNNSQKHHTAVGWNKQGPKDSSPSLRFNNNNKNYRNKKSPEDYISISDIQQQ